MKNKILKFLFAVVLCEGAGIIGAFFTTPAIGSWYATLTKPSFNPPNWIFAPVWTLLFFLMGVALYLIFQEKSKGKNIQTALLVFFQQLALNVLWSALFFGMQNPKLAFVEIIVLWFAILMAIFYFAKISKIAAWLLVPYILWVSFAGYLNYSIWQISAHVPGQVACTTEAMLCPDGSAVGRTGPNCEFALCPLNNISIEIPKQIVTEFYQGYLKVINGRSGALAVKEYIKDSNDLEENYKERLLEEKVRLADPVIWASDAPPENNFKVSNIVVNDSIALADVTFPPLWPNHKLRVSLFLINNEWKISSVEDIGEN